MASGRGRGLWRRVWPLGEGVTPGGRAWPLWPLYWKARGRDNLGNKVVRGNESYMSSIAAEMLESLIKLL